MKLELPPEHDPEDDGPVESLIVFACLALFVVLLCVAVAKCSH